MSTCPPSHRHSMNTTCYHAHGCRCTPCRNGLAQRGRDRRRAVAYGTYQTLVPATGTARRIHGLYLLGWTSQDIANLTGMERKRVNNLTRSVHVTPRVRDLIITATRELLSRGRGGSDITIRRAQARGWVSLFEWDSIDDDPLTAEEKHIWAA